MREIRDQSRSLTLALFPEKEAVLKGRRLRIKIRNSFRLYILNNLAAMMWGEIGPARCLSRCNEHLLKY